jgi:hypothetical protein
MRSVYDYLQEKEKHGDIHGVEILNGAFTEIIFAPFTGYFDGKGTFSYWGTGDEKLQVTTMADAAAYTAEVAMDPTATDAQNC